MSMAVMSRKAFGVYPGTPVGVWAAVDAIIATTGMRVAQRTDDYLLGELGSQVSMRLKGGMLSSLDEFPLKVEIRVVANDPGSTSVWVEVRDNFGFGSRFGARNKFQQAIDMRMADFVRALGVADSTW
jgi:hypothetical protein